MSSQALYRKWRSQTFDDLVGQAHIVQALRNAITADRIGHAYLFTGPRGVGKTSAARILSKAVNCEQADPQLRPCGECAACVAIADGRAIDVIEMDAASHTSVDDAREIIERVQFRPTSFRIKVYIIDEVHMLSTAAFNALLKTLEEPPDHAMFILATTEFHKVPATIISRCQRFVFNRHTVQNTVEHLEWIAGQEGVQLEPGVGEAIARSATGSMRDAVSVLDQLIGYGDAIVPLERVQSLLGATAAQEVQMLVGALTNNAVAEALTVINAVADQGADLRQFTRDVVGYLRGLMLLKSNGDPSLLDLGTEALQAMQAAAHVLELGAILSWLKIFSNLDHQLRTSPYGQLPLEMAVVEALVVPPPAVTAPAARGVPRQTASASVAAAGPPQAGTPARPAVVREAAAVRPPPVVEAAPAGVASVTLEPEPAAAEPEPAAPIAVAPLKAILAAALAPTADEHIVLAESEVVLAEIESIWAQLVEDLKPFNPRLQAVLKSCEPATMEDTMLVIGTPSPFHTKQLEELANQRLLEDLISKRLGRQLQIRSEQLNKEQQSKTRDARRQREELMKDQIVKAARNIFDARIVGVQEDG